MAMGWESNAKPKRKAVERASLCRTHPNAPLIRMNPRSNHIRASFGSGSPFGMAHSWPDGGETALRLANAAILHHSIRNLSNLARSYLRLGDDSLLGRFRCLSW